MRQDISQMHLMHASDPQTAASCMVSSTSGPSAYSISSCSHAILRCLASQDIHELQQAAYMQHCSFGKTQPKAAELTEPTMQAKDSAIT